MGDGIDRVLPTVKRETWGVDGADAMRSRSMITLDRPKSKKRSLLTLVTENQDLSMACPAGGAAPAVGAGGGAAESAGVRSAAKLNCHLMLPVSVGARWGPDRSCHPRRAVLRPPAIVSRRNSGVSGFCPFGGWVTRY